MFFKGVIIVAAIALGVISVAVMSSYDFEDSQYSLNGKMENNSEKIIDFTRQFIINGPTFSYDGIAETLEIEIVSADDSDSKFLLEGKFKTFHTGYGNRENLDLPEDITLHTITVSVVDEKIISAVIDNQWDELNQITCNTAQC
ncbi:MAG: hypothetical protein OES23_01455 [Nitrosopumilus sp.]|nr:hypothetical protein [Nitrosopumilus sp.]